MEMSFNGIESKWKNIKLGQAKWIDTGPLSRDCGIHV